MFGKKKQPPVITPAPAPSPKPDYVECEAKLANVLLIRPLQNKGITFVKMEVDKLPEGAQPIMAEWVGQWLYFIEEHLGKVYRNYEYRDAVDQLPSKLIKAINMPANRAWWSMSRNPLEKLAMWAPVAVIAVGMILLFAMGSNKPGAPIDANAPIQAQTGQLVGGGQ